MTELYLIPEQGWKLVTENNVTVCGKCMKKLELPFYFCKETSMAFHQECEIKAVGRVCTIFKDEHIHYNVIFMDKNNFLNLLFAFLSSAL